MRAVAVLLALSLLLATAVAALPEGDELKAAVVLLRRFGFRFASLSEDGNSGPCPRPPYACRNYVEDCEKQNRM